MNKQKREAPNPNRNPLQKQKQKKKNSKGDQENTAKQCKQATHAKAFLAFSFRSASFHSDHGFCPMKSAHPVNTLIYFEF
jgi:hypothetical protein